MARTSDPDLFDRILSAARELWEKGGDAGFNLRDVARLAGTSPPTLYTRYDSRDDLLRVLRDQQVAELQATLHATGTISSLCDTYLREADSNPRRYELIFGPNWLNRTTRPDVELFLGSLVERIRHELGCDAAQSRRAAFQVWLLLHGAAMQRIGEPAAGEMWSMVASLCLDACERLIRSFNEPESAPMSPSSAVRPRRSQAAPRRKASHDS
jgi:AcrR family transcriptional regulator